MKMTLAVVLATSFLNLSTATFATGSNGDDDTQTTPAKPIPVNGTGSWLHTHNRVIAFGSIIMEKGGSDINSWKAVNPYGFCLSQGGGVVLEELTDGGTDPVVIGPGNGLPPSTTCGWSLAVTTSYQFTVCPDGQAIVSRSGEGVTMTTISEGQLYSWAEVSLCSSGPFFDTATPKDRQDANRPLDLAHLTITMKN